MIISILCLLSCGEKSSTDSAQEEENQQPELSIDDLQIGDLVITEIMVDPSDCDDAISEYIEMKNTTDRWVNINGMVIRDNGNEYQITEDILASPDSLILGRINSTEDCYLLAADFLYDLQWNNGDGDLVEIVNTNGPLDTVDYSNWSIPTGASLSLDPANIDVTSNDNENSWCAASEAIANEYEDMGSPGNNNPPCPMK